MEYLEGETLAARLTKGPLPTDQVLRYATEIADALDKAHRKGITHRDLKPGNRHCQVDGPNREARPALANLAQISAGTRHLLPDP